jgi:protein-S-isoprenylcysteine O-methyltransferase Ste14
MASMIDWINFIVLVMSAVLMAHFYIKSVGPAALEKEIGESAYSKCKQYRIIASVFEVMTIVNYLIYYFYPLSIDCPRLLPWEYWISVVVGFVILIPSLTLMFKGLRVAGMESLEPKKKHTLYGGIYETLQHPQAIGEAFIWLAISFFLNSPFLILYSFLWFPIFYVFCLAEERDLVIRYGQPYLEYRDRVGFLIPKRKQKD